MNIPITIHGNLTADPVLRTAPSGTQICSFTVAVNDSGYDRSRGDWVGGAPMLHRVVCFHRLADNVAGSLRKGHAITITGKLVDASHTPSGVTRQRGQTQLRADDVAASLRHTTVAVVNGAPRDQPAAAAEVTRAVASVA